MDKPKVKNESYFTYVKTYFNFWYYIGVIPFKISYNRPNNSFKVHTNKFQLGVFIIITLFAFLQSFGNLRFEIHHPPKSGSRILGYFHTLYAIGCMFTYFCFFATISLRRLQFEVFINYMHSTILQDNSHITHYKISKKLLGSIITFITLVEIFAMLEVLEDKDWEVYYFLKEYFDRGTCMLLTCAPSTDILNFHEASITLRVMFFTLGCGLMRLSYLIKVAGDTMLIFSVMSMNLAVKQTQSKLKKGNILEILHELEKLKTVSDLNNEAVGLNAFGVMFGCIPTIIYAIPQIIQPSGLCDFADCAFNCVLPFIFLVLSSQFSHRVYYLFERWLDEFEGSISEPELSILLYQLSERKISFEFGGFIKFSDGFLGAVTSLVLTFAVVKIQFQERT